MPHSSGGGSHSGGGHSGSSHSGGSSRPAVSRTYYPGARTYVYYHHNTPHYIYTDEDLLNRKRSKARYLLLLLYLPFALIFLSFLMDSVLPAQKLKNTEHYQVVINDHADVISNENELYQSLWKFKETTGITPAVITENNEDWQGYYTSLENRAYDLYVNNFSDETHWLIVYSEPVQPISAFNDWHWEGMQGDDTDGILTESKTEKFNEKMQRYLTVDSYDTGTAIRKAFDDITPGIMKKEVSVEGILVPLIIMIFLVVHAYFMVFYDPFRKYKKENLTEIKDEDMAKRPRLRTCSYCRGQYVVGVHLNCPHCGALTRENDDE